MFTMLLFWLSFVTARSHLLWQKRVLVKSGYIDMFGFVHIDVHIFFFSLCFSASLDVLKSAQREKDRILLQIQ